MILEGFPEPLWLNPRCAGGTIDGIGPGAVILRREASTGFRRDFSSSDEGSLKERSGRTKKRKRNLE